MRFHARVGILPHEQEIPQPLEIDLTVRLGPGPEVVDYRGLYDDVASVVTTGASALPGADRRSGRDTGAGAAAGGACARRGSKTARGPGRSARLC
jgi:hypothetical protein